MHDMGFLVNYPFVQLANYLGSKPILNITVHEYLWGYDDDLISLAGTVVPSYIDFDKFGLLDRVRNYPRFKKKYNFLQSQQKRWW